MFTPEGPSLRELATQALTSVDRGYDLLAPKFNHTPFRTPDRVLDETVQALAGLGPFDRGLDVCCGTGAGLAVLRRTCQGDIVGADFSAGMLAESRRAHPAARLVRADVRAMPFTGAFDLAVSFGALGHFLPSERPGLFAEVHRSLRPGGLFAMPLGAPPPRVSLAHGVMLGFDLAMYVRNKVIRPPFVMYYSTTPVPAVRADLAAAGFTVETRELAGLGRYRDGTARCALLLAHKPDNAA